MCAKFVDKYITNIFLWQANSFEHVDVLCGLGTTLYNLLPCGAVMTISGNLYAWEFSREFLRCALANSANWPCIEAPIAK